MAWAMVWADERGQSSFINILDVVSTELISPNPVNMHRVKIGLISNYLLFFWL
jgi:hypothetical protein